MESKKQSKSVKEPQPKRFSKNEISFTHDLYKLNPEVMLKNVHYKKYDPRIEEVEHAHFFHSVSSRGKENEYCNFVGGHTHKIETYVDESGELKAKCGPPLAKVWKQGRGGVGKFVYEEIVFENQWGEVIRKDDHTHDVEYKGSEELQIKNQGMAGAQAASNYPQARLQATLEQSAAIGAKYAAPVGE